MDIAVTGGLGRLGRYVVRALERHSVRVLDIGAPTFCRVADLCDLDALREHLRGIEVVVHLGGIDRSVAVDDAATMEVNAMGTWNLFEASLRTGVRRVVHCSSSSVLGLDPSNPEMAPCYLPIDEVHPLRPTDAYGLSKLCGERIAEAYSRRGLEVIVIRPCFVAFPEMADFMAGRPGPQGRTEPMPYLRTFVGPRIVRAASLPRRRSSTPASRRSSSPPKTRSRPSRPSADWRHSTDNRFLCMTQRSSSGCRMLRRSAMPRLSGAWAGCRRCAGRLARTRLDWPSTRRGGVRWN
jgi:NAD(P)-dependent dehydrogenase (short-subunit alcohol dehydrogenase family)